MDYPSKLVEEAVEQFSKLPGLGKKTALRFVLNILKMNKQEVSNFGNAFHVANTNWILLDAIADAPAASGPDGSIQFASGGAKPARRPTPLRRTCDRRAFEQWSALQVALAH